MEIDETITKKYFEGRISVREFLADFFGALMPGVIFLSLFGFSIMLPIIIGCQSLIHLDNMPSGIMEAIINQRNLNLVVKLPIVFQIAVVFIYLIIGYALGTMFYRRDPKDSDYQSFLKIVKNFSKSHLQGWVIKVSDEKLIDDPKKINKKTLDSSSVLYPYDNLKEYLLSRGRNELADLITWDANEPDQVTEGQKIFKQRSKIFINALKIRLQFYFPEQCSTIITNEAHIRFSSSMWYAFLTMEKYSPLAIFFSVFFYSLRSLMEGTPYDRYDMFFIMTAFISIIVWMLAAKLKSVIEKFLHYQRVREIFYVIETAYTASKFKPRGFHLLFEGL